MGGLGFPHLQGEGVAGIARASAVPGTVPVPAARLRSQALAYRVLWELLSSRHVLDGATEPQCVQPQPQPPGRGP